MPNLKDIQRRIGQPGFACDNHRGSKGVRYNRHHVIVANSIGGEHASRELGIRAVEGARKLTGHRNVGGYAGMAKLSAGRIEGRVLS